MQDANFSIHVEPLLSLAGSLASSATELDQLELQAMRLDQKLITRRPEARFTLFCLKQLC